jgi:hypothetical protein
MSTSTTPIRQPSPVCPTMLAAVAPAAALSADLHANVPRDAALAALRDGGLSAVASGAAMATTHHLWRPIAPNFIPQ